MTQPRKIRKIDATYRLANPVPMPCYDSVCKNTMPGFQTITATNINNQVATVIGNLLLNAIFGVVP